MDIAKKLADVVDMVYLSRDNAAFSRENGFLTLETNGERYPHVQLHRAFPFELEYSYVSVLDDERQEIGLILDIEKDFDEPTRTLLHEELSKKYFCPKIERITAMKDNYGFIQIEEDTDIGHLSFGVRDIYRNLIKAGGGRVYIVDVDGNRYEIPDSTKLDRASAKKLELYL